MTNEVTYPADGQPESQKHVQDALAEYERRKHDLAQILREIRAAAYKAKDDALERSVVDVTHKLAEDRFYLTVVGQFSRGKSTLMNAILGKDYLPSGVIPTTSAITAVSYGSRERVVLRFIGSNLTSETGIHELADVVTGKSNSADRVEMAEVQVPVEFLQRGFFLVDTPGLGSAVRENTATTLNFLPSADAIVFVTSCDSPLSAGELGYLRQCRSEVQQMFLVVNKMDLVPLSERERVIEFVKSKSKEELEDADVRIYAVSAKDALAARLSSSEGKLTESGLPQLEEAIVEYVTAHKQEDALLQVCDRASELLAGSTVSQREELLGRICALRSQIEGSTRSGELSWLRRQLAPSTTPGRSLLRVSCAICDRIVDAVFDFLRSYQYDLSVSTEVQHAHAEGGGFCAMHTWQYADLASPQGICSAYPQVLFRFSEDLLDLAEGHVQKHATGGVAAPPLPAGRTCPACQRACQAEQKAVQQLAAHLEGEEKENRDNETSLCLTHLEDVLLAMHNTSAAKLLLMRESEALRRIGENLQRYALKHEGRRSDLITEEEWQAPKQALTLLTGHRNVQPRFGKS